MNDPLRPQPVPRAAHDLPPSGGVLGPEPEDFVVEEDLAYAPSGDGTHLYLWIEKRNITTHEAVRRLARFLDRPTHDFGSAGLKDKHAITRQWISIEHADPERLRGWTVNGVSVLRAERHGHKLRIGHARGNRFVVRICNIPRGGLGRAFALAERISASGIPNAYGPQRFGRGGESAAMGRALMLGDAAAFEALAGRKPEHVERSVRSLLLSALQSEAFNRVLARRMPDLRALEDGDVAMKHDSGGSFVVASARDEQPRADAFEISATGPIPGERLLQGAGRPRAIEDAVLAELELEPYRFATLPYGLEARGARRPLRVAVGGLSIEPLGDDGARLRFSLPSGSYASVVVAELAGESAWTPSGPGDRPIGEP